MNSNKMSTSFSKEIFVEICIPDINDDYKDTYEMYIYDECNGVILAAVSKIDGEIITIPSEINMETAGNLFEDFKKEIIRRKKEMRRFKIDQIT